MACFLTTWSLNITWRPILSKKQTKRKFPNFDQYGNYLKLIFYRLGGLFFLTRWSSDIIFRPNMSKKKSNEKFLFLDRTHGLQKKPTWWLCKMNIFFSLARPFFYYMIIRTLVSGLIFPKTNRENFQLLTKTWVSPFEKILIWPLCTTNIFLV